MTWFDNVQKKRNPNRWTTLQVGPILRESLEQWHNTIKIGDDYNIQEIKEEVKDDLYQRMVKHKGKDLPERSTKRYLNNFDKKGDVKFDRIIRAFLNKNNYREYSKSYEKDRYEKMG
jgi:hypothetical protein|tara:strand:+ start:433 stop:783 length:351 start_codon:yes stop_codon:yes gene_type:complete